MKVKITVIAVIILGILSIVGMAMLETTREEVPIFSYSCEGVAYSVGINHCLISSTTLLSRECYNIKEKLDYFNKNCDGGITPNTL